MVMGRRADRAQPVSPGVGRVNGAHIAIAPVIAVLPFKNLSSEPDSDYFVDGLTTKSSATSP